MRFLAHGLVEEDVELCWRVGISKTVPGVLAVTKGEYQLVLVSRVDFHGPKAVRNVYRGEETGPLYHN